MSDVRNYRHGKKHRSGNVNSKKFCEDLGFKTVKFTKGFIGSDKIKVLNNAYDGLMDLSEILGFQPLFMSLLGTDEQGLGMYFSQNKKIPNGLVFDSFNQYAINWFKALDRSIGNFRGYEGGLVKNINSLNQEEFPELFTLLKSIKVKKVLSNYFDAPEMETALNELYELLESIPILSQETVEEVASVEDTIIVFKRELTIDTFEKMMSAVNEYIEKYGIQLGSLKEQLRICFDNINNINRSLLYNAPQTVEVETDYMKKLKDFYLGDDDLRILAIVFECYVIEKGKEKDISNNYLHGDPSSKSIVYPMGDEKTNMLVAMHNYLISVINTYEYDFTKNKRVEDKDNLDIENNINKDKENIEKEEINNLKDKDNIDKVLSEDNGKFKLTLFKQLSKEMGLIVDSSNVSYYTDRKVYYIPFKDSNLQFIKVSSYNNPAESNHCINIYTGPNGDTKNGYWWDNELDYKALITELLTYCKGNEKFKLTYFKELCKENKLKVSFNESLMHVNKKKIKVDFNNSYIKYVLVPPYASDVIVFEIKTIKEELEYKQENTFNYDEIVSHLVNIENNGVAEIQKAKEELEEARNRDIAKYEEVKKEYDNRNQAKNIFKEITDCSNVKELKDLRKKLSDYVALGTQRVNYIHNLENVIDCLKDNLLKNAEQIYKFQLGVIPEGKGMGCSKSWVFDKKNHSIIIPKSGEYRKQLEGVIESEITLLFRHNLKLPLCDEKLYIECVTYMICKNFGLDVRTYCQDRKFATLINGDKGKISEFLVKCIKLYERYGCYFVMN